VGSGLGLSALLEEDLSQRFTVAYPTIKKGIGDNEYCRWQCLAVRVKPIGKPRQNQQCGYGQTWQQESKPSSGRSGLCHRRMGNYIFNFWGWFW